MMHLALWQAVLLGLSLGAAIILLIIWWRQQSRRWWMMLIVSVVTAPTLSWWSGLAFHVADYRAGCDGLCPGWSGAPISFYLGEAAGHKLMIGGFLLNTMVYWAIALGWAALVRAITFSVEAFTRRNWIVQAVSSMALIVVPLALSPLVLPPPEARVRGDPQRVAINARREVYLYDQLADWPILRVGLDDVRPRSDNQTGMRVCLRTYTFFYLPSGAMFLDMTPEGVHSNNGGVLPSSAACWEPAPG